MKGTQTRPSSRPRQPKRDWAAAREKVEREGGCRLAYQLERHCVGPIQAAHIIGREVDKNALPGDHFNDITGKWYVYAVRIVPLCRHHHRLYDAHELDLLGYLTAEEEAQAVLDAGSLETARRRICPTAYGQNPYPAEEAE